MAKKGDAAREAVKNTIINAFGDKFVDFVDKKIYVEAQDGPGGETLQFAITMTMPKTPVARGNARPTSASAESSSIDATVPAAPVQLSDDDAAKVAQLMEKLGLS